MRRFLLLSPQMTNKTPDYNNYIIFISYFLAEMFIIIKFTTNKYLC